MRFWIGVVVIVLLGVSGYGVAAADPSADFYAKQLAALGRVHSMRIHRKNAVEVIDAMDIRDPSGVAMVIHDARYGETEARRVNGVIYTRSNGGPWSAPQVDAATSSAIADGSAMLRDATVTLEADDQGADGKVYGVERVLARQSTGRSALGAEMLCSYDKQTYRLIRCVGHGAELDFSHYDDPENRIEAPSLGHRGT